MKTHDRKRLTINSYSLVLVNGLAILQKEVDGSPKTILSQLFPRAIIDDFSFLSPSTVEWRLHQRALALLEQLLKTWGACKASHHLILFEELH